MLWKPITPAQPAEEYTDLTPSLQITVKPHIIGFDYFVELWDTQRGTRIARWYTGDTKLDAIEAVQDYITQAHTDYSAGINRIKTRKQNGSLAYQWYTDKFRNKTCDILDITPELKLTLSYDKSRTVASLLYGRNWKAVERWNLYCMKTNSRDKAVASVLDYLNEMYLKFTDAVSIFQQTQKGETT